MDRFRGLERREGGESRSGTAYAPPMPELPAVEFGRRVAEHVAAGRRIVDLHCARDPIVYEGVSPQRFRSALLGRLVRAVHRRGKHLFFELDERPWPLFHFGMTGAFRVPDIKALPLVSWIHDDETQWPPRFTKIRIVFHDGGELVMTNARRLGRIRLREDPLTEPPLSKLGFDPLLDLPSTKVIAEQTARRRVAIKALLLNQSFAAGVGNWIADEVLYQAKVDPRRPANTLTLDEVKLLRAKLRSVIRTAVNADASRHGFPRTWLFHHRWGKQADARTSRGETIEHLTLAGRTTAWVPSVQR